MTTNSKSYKVRGWGSLAGSRPGKKFIALGLLIVFAGVADLGADTWKDSKYWYVGRVSQFHKGAPKVGKGTATLISKNWALTAKHVARFKIKKPNGGPMRIVFGAGNKVYAAKVFGCPDKDIALLKLNKKVTNIEPAALMKDTFKKRDGLIKFTHVGCGKGRRVKRRVRGRGYGNSFDIKKGKPGVSGDSGGFFGFERSHGNPDVQFAVIHGGGNGPQVGPVRKWITSTIKAEGGDQPTWVSKSDAVAGYGKSKK